VVAAMFTAREDPWLTYNAMVGGCEVIHRPSANGGPRQYCVKLLGTFQVERVARSDDLQRIRDR